MMTTLKNKLQATAVAASLTDANLALRSVTKYAWLSAGILFVGYLYFVGAITFSVIKQEGLSQNIKAIVSETSKEELKYLNLQKGLTEGYAKERGFVSAHTISYTAAASTFAWNFDARQ